MARSHMAVSRSVQSSSNLREIRSSSAFSASCSSFPSAVMVILEPWPTASPGRTIPCHPVGHAHPPSGQPDPRNPAQILPGGCGICRRQGRQRLWGPGPGSSSQKVEKLFPSCLYKKKNRTPRFLFFEQLKNNPCPNTHAFPWRGHEQKAFYCSFLIGGAGNNQPGPGNRAIHTTTAQDD